MSQCYVYIIGHVVNGQAVGPVKVGIADNPWARLSGLQTGNPAELRIVHVFTAPSRDAARGIEASFHVVMAPERLRGEWFDITPFTALWRMCQFLRVDAYIEGIGYDETAERAMAEMGVVAAERIVASTLSAAPEAVQ